MQTILIADDHQIVRAGLKMIIESFPEKYRILEAASCAEVIELISVPEIDYIILDLFLADGNIFSAIHQFHKHSQKTGVLIYSMNTEKIYGRRLMQKGIFSFISKQAPVRELEKAICCLFQGEVYLSEAMKEGLFKAVDPSVPKNPVDLLSDRELEVVEYLTIGIGSREISQKMKVDITTVSTYRKRAFEKLRVNNNIELRDKFLLFKMQQ